MAHDDVFFQAHKVVNLGLILLKVSHGKARKAPHNPGKVSHRAILSNGRSGSSGSSGNSNSNSNSRKTLMRHGVHHLRANSHRVMRALQGHRAITALMLTALISHR